MRIGSAAALVLAALVGCQNLEPKPARDKAPEATAPRPEPEREAEPAPAPKAEPDYELPWIHDDYTAALALAREKSLPLVIDMSADWCHTCLAMEQAVLSDPTLERIADRYVWLSLDTDKAANAAAIAKFPVRMWPTFYVVSPIDESIQARHPGAASLAQLRRFLAAGERGYLASRAAAGTLDKSSPLYHVRRGDRAAAANKPRAAAAAYGKALAAGGAGWERRPEVLVMRIAALARANRWDECVTVAEDALDTTGTTASAADFCAWANGCAAQIKDQARATALRRKLVQRISTVFSDPEASLSMDDRSEALRIQRNILVDLGETRIAKEVARHQRRLLDAAVARAQSPLEVMTYNGHRVDVYLFLGEGQALVPALKAHVAKVPEAYDPPYRLAQLYAGMKRYDDALEMANRALERAYGPRSAGIARFVADLHHELGDAAGELAARKRVVKIYASLPPGQQNPEGLKKARAALAKLTRTPRH